MAKFELKFLDTNEEKKIEVFKNEKEVLGLKNDFIRIIIEEEENGCITYFDMDKSTAIKFAKTLRTEINKIKESEVENG